MINLDSETPLLIAEIGGNHQGSLSKAKELMISARESGADIVKFQSYSGDGLVNKKLRSDRFEHFNSFMLKDNEWIELAEFAQSNHIPFSSSIWETHYLDLLDKYICLYKVGSGDLNNFELLEKFVSTKKPLIISTAMANIEMLRTVYDFLIAVNPRIVQDKRLGILQCTAIYDDPIPEHVSLRAMDLISKEFPCIVGFSNHAIGIHTSIAAIARGAKIIEFHFTFDKDNDSFRDHRLSFDSKDLLEIKSFCEKFPKILGNNEKIITPKESSNTQEFRRGVFFANQIKKGDIIKKEDLTFLRPEIGISMWDDYKSIIGKKAKKDIEELEPLDFNFFD